MIQSDIPLLKSIWSDQVTEAILKVPEAMLDVPEAILDVPEAILDVPEAILRSSRGYTGST
jgi:hypothetical protein